MLSYAEKRALERGAKLLVSGLSLGEVLERIGPTTEAVTAHLSRVKV